MSDKASQTEEATPKKLSDAKKKGQVAKSPDLSSAVSLFMFTLLIGVLGQYMMTNSQKFFRNSFNVNYGTPLTGANAGTMLINSVMQFALFLMPFAIVTIIIGIVVNLAQIGFLFTTKPLIPDFKKLNPIEGFKNIVSKKAMFNLVKNLLKLTMVFYMSYINVKDSINQILNSGNIGSEKLFFFFMDLLKTLSFNIAMIMLGLAVVDYVFQRRDHRKNLKMSKQDIKDEHKQMEGNPEMKAARQRRQREISMSKMMSSIPTATVVVTNPTHIAVVLRYDTDKDQAPLVTAKGADYMAQKIKELAKENNIPIMENVELARAMFKKVEIGDYVPVELYKAIAEILALVHQMKEKRKKQI